MALANKDPQQIEAALAAWLESRLPGARLTSCEVPSASGMSNLTVLLSAQIEGRPLDLVARVAPDGPAVFPTYDLEREARVMNALSDRGLPVPTVRWVESDPSVLGSPFMVIERAFGRVPADDPPFTATGWVLDLTPEQQHELCERSLAALAQVHDVDWRAAGLGDLAPDGDPLTADLAYWKGFYDWARGEDVNPTVEAGLAWIEAHRPDDDREPVLTWGDARIGNMMFGDDLSVRAILDWEMVGVGQPDAEVAWWLFILRHHTEGIGMPVPAGFPSREDVARLYEKASGRALPHLDFYEVWAAVRLAIIMHRAGNLMIELGLLPAGAPMRLNNPASQLLAKLIGAPAPTGDAQSFIGNR